MDLKTTYNRIAKDWMQDHHGDTWWIKGTEKYASFLKPNASILDVGCGAGEKSKFLIKKRFKVIGIDFSEEMIKLAKKQVPTGIFFVKDIKQPLKFKILFDGIFAQAVLLHISKKEVINVLKNITGSLKSNGYFYVAVKELQPGNKDEEIIKENDYGYKYERFFSYFTLDELKSFITKIGLQIIYDNVISSGKTNWIQIIAKKPNCKLIK